MVELLEVVDFPVRKGSLMMEAPVPNTPPFLITKTSSLYWRPNHVSGSIQTGFRKDKVERDGFYKEVIQSILKKSEECRWGNLFSLRKRGLESAIKRMESFEYGPEEIEVLTRNPPRFKCDYTLAEWMPASVIAVVPKDRGYLGWVHDGPEGLTSVVHNSARAICLLVSDAKLGSVIVERVESELAVEGLLDGEGGE